VARRRNVLLVETNQEIQSAITALLRGSPFRLSAYSDRWAAFRAMKRTRAFDVALIDQDMACIGVERSLFPSMLRHLKKDLDVIILSENYPAQKNSELATKGFREFLSKSELDSKLLRSLRATVPTAAQKAASIRAQKSKKARQRPAVAATRSYPHNN
jgi:DNA-binding NtrC family response regulator